MTMIERKLGRGGLRVSALGLGCMGMSEFYGPSQMDDAESIRVIHRYLDAGGNFLDTADMYGVGRNEELVGRAIAGRRDRAVLATKFGNVRGPKGEFLGVRGDARYVRDCCEASLSRMKVDVIDLYYQHRVDPKVPIEETVGAMAELVRAGKVRYLGPLRGGSRQRSAGPRPSTPYRALQTEYSLWSRDPEQRDPLHRAQLRHRVRRLQPPGQGLPGRADSGRSDDLPADDYRRNSPAVPGREFPEEPGPCREVESLARAKGCTPSQLALAWVLAQGEDIVPIPGTKRTRFLDENLGALAVRLSPEEMRQVDAVLPAGVTAGERYPAQSMQAVNR